MDYIEIDGKNYDIVKEIKSDDTTYVYLLDSLDNLLIQKHDVTNNLLINLEDEKEYIKALNLYKNEK